MKKNSIKVLSLAMMAGFAGIGTFMTPNVLQTSTRDFQQTVKRDHSNRNQTPETQRISQESKSMQISNETRRGYSSSNGWDMGIDPKTYGMYFVKRGTHKRTNI